MNRELPERSRTEDKGVIDAAGRHGKAGRLADHEIVDLAAPRTFQRFDATGSSPGSGREIRARQVADDQGHNDLAHRTELVENTATSQRSLMPDTLGLGVADMPPARNEHAGASISTVDAGQVSMAVG